MSEPYWIPLGVAGGVLDAAGISTTLPASPVDGQDAILVDSLTAPTYAWRFRYVASITDAFKWVFLGGSPLVSEVVTDETCNSTAYVDLATVGPQITVPRAGIYKLRFGGIYWITTAAATIVYLSPKLGAAATADADAASVNQATGNMPSATITRAPITRTLAASDVVKLQYRNSAGGAVTHWIDRFLEILPTRLG